MSKSQAIQAAKNRYKITGRLWIVKVVKEGFWTDIFRLLTGSQIYQVVTAFRATNHHVKMIQTEYGNLAFSKENIDELQRELKLYSERALY